MSRNHKLNFLIVQKQNWKSTGCTNIRLSSTSSPRGLFLVAKKATRARSERLALSLSFSLLSCAARAQLFTNGELARSQQLFRERLSEKVHATIPKSIVGRFEFTVLQINLKKCHDKPWVTCVCEDSRIATKVGSTATMSGTVY